MVKLQPFHDFQVLIMRDLQVAQVVLDDKNRKLLQPWDDDWPEESFPVVEPMVAFFPHELASDVEQELLELLPADRGNPRHTG